MCGSSGEPSRHLSNRSSEIKRLEYSSRDWVAVAAKCRQFVDCTLSHTCTGKLVKDARFENENGTRYDVTSPFEFSVCRMTVVTSLLDATLLRHIIYYKASRKSD